MVQTLDENVGRVLARLKERHLADKTLVIFASDNGGYVNTNCGLQVTDNWPLRSGKGSLYEGGIRVPLIVRLPGVTTPGTTCDELVMCTDFFPTIRELCGLNVSNQPASLQPPDGLSLVPLLRQPRSTLPRDALFFNYPHYYPTTTPVSAVLSRDWKLLDNFEDNHIDLYCLRDDPGEKHDLAAAQPERAVELRARLHSWWQELGRSCRSQTRPTGPNNWSQEDWGCRRPSHARLDRQDSPLSPPIEGQERPFFIRISSFCPLK
jgi:arylsulfatase A-like enzyme